MEQHKRRFQPSEDWPLQEAYKQRLHEDIQRWGECIAQKLETYTDGLDQERMDFFQFLMESVPRNDSMTAMLIQTLRAQMYESTRSWYTNQLGSLDRGQEQDVSCRDFERLFAIYHAGCMSQANT